MIGLQQNTGFYAILMLFAGIGIPIMAALNSGLGARLQNPPLAVTILLVVALTTSLSCLLILKGIPSTVYNPPTPFYFYLGGVFFVFYILSVTWVAPSFGVGNTIAIVLLGQIISIATIDHFGLMGATQFSFTLQRFFGVILMSTGVFLVVSKS